MSTLKKNVASGYVAEVWTGVCAIAFAPVYIYLIGIEGYGLIGFFTAMQAMFGLLDLGLNSTLNREVARLRANDSSASEMRDFVRTLEIPYWLVGFAIAATILAASKMISTQWIDAEGLSSEMIRNSIVLMGCIMAFRWPISFYNGGLSGLEKQVWMNGVKAFFVTLQGVGAILLLWLVSASVDVFFRWHLLVSMIHAGFMAFSLYRFLPKCSRKPRFSMRLLASVWKFAAGMSLITLLTTIMMQLDKLILSWMLPLDKFGYYSLASAVALSLKRCVIPVFNAIYPRFSHLAGAGLVNEISAIYHKSTQLVSAMLLPAASVLILFSREILALWTRDATIAYQSYMLVGLLVAGKCFYSLTYVPYALQLAYGWTLPAILGNLVMVAFMAPLLIIMTSLYGVQGAAAVWLALALFFFLIVPAAMHRRILKGETYRWYIKDIAYPLLAGLAVVVPARWIISPHWSTLSLLAAIGLTGFASLCATAFASSELRVARRLKTIAELGRSMFRK